MVTDLRGASGSSVRPATRMPAAQPSSRSAAHGEIAPALLRRGRVRRPTARRRLCPSALRDLLSWSALIVEDDAPISR